MRKLRFLAAAALLALVAAACSSNTTTPSSGGSTPAGTTASPLTNKGTKDATSLSSTEVEQDNEGSEFYFKPTFLKVKGGQKLTIELKNEGSVQHTFTIDSLNIDETLDPDKSKDVVVTFPAGGGSDIQFHCRFHVAQGMRGAFFFGAAPAATGGSATGSSTTGY